ncbi:MAG: hypothetical protein RLZZ203_36 [Cyanobacteriota bacterium]|jgi:hypothetical protein
MQPLKWISPMFKIHLFIEEFDRHYFFNKNRGSWGVGHISYQLSVISYQFKREGLEVNEWFTVGDRLFYYRELWFINLIRILTCRANEGDR